MPPVSVGSVVQRENARWLVVEVVTAVGGALVAQLECLDRDASAAVDAARLDDVVEMTADEVRAARARRDATENPRRLRHAIALHGKRIARAEAALAKLRAAVVNAKERLAAGDMRAIENREIVPGQVVSIAPDALLKMCENGIAGNERMIAQAKADRDADVAALAKMGG